MPRRSDVSLGQDKGGADLIAEGRIKVKHGVEINHLAENSVVFTDGSELPADIVILAFVSRSSFCVD